MSRALTLATVLVALVVAPLAPAAQVGVGDLAPPFTVTTLDGDDLSLANLLDQGPTVINFFRTDCSHCRHELAVVQQLLTEDEFAGIRFIAINVREPEEVVQAYVDDEGLSFPVALDPRMVVTRSYRVAILPRMFFVRQDGIVDQLIGVADEDTIRQAFRDHLATSADRRPPVLLVVPDVTTPDGSTLVSLARQTGYEPIVWDLATQGPIPESVVLGYVGTPAVRLLTEGQPYDVIDDAEDFVWSGFLSDGGRLMLCGNHAAVGAQYSDVLRFYFVSRYVGSTTGFNQLRGADNQPDFASFDFALTDDYGANGARPNHLFAPVGPEASAALVYADEVAGQPDLVAALLVET